MQNRGWVIGCFALVAASCAFLLFGVGQTDGGDADKVEATVESYLRAFASGDGKKACEALTDNAREAVAGLGTRMGAPDCPTAMERTRQIGGPEVRAIARKIRVRKVDVEGHGARVVLRASGRDTIAELEKVGDDWKIATLPKG